MIFLKSENSIILETLNQSKSSPVSRIEKLDISFQDHSGGIFHLYCHKKQEMRLAARLRAWNEISKDKELVEILRKDFGDLWKEGGDVDEGFDVTIACNLETLLKNDEKIKLFSQLKQKIISIPLARLFVTKSSPPPPFTIKNDDSGDFYTVAPGVNGDQIIVLFGISFIDQTDTILARVFLQEFFNSRNKLDDAPVVLLGKEPPKELVDHVVKSEKLNYLTLVLFSRHYSTPTAQTNLLEIVPFFSDYLHYHLKCSKAYLHQRMRAKTGDFLKILNRAKPENLL